MVREKVRILARDLGLELVERTEGPEELGGLQGFKAWMAERAAAASATSATTRSWRGRSASTVRMAAKPKPAGRRRPTDG